MPTPRRILETAFYVSDLDRSERLYRALLGATVKLSDDRMRALALADGSVLLLFRIGGSVEGEPTPGGHIPGHDGRGRLHVAFEMDARDVDAWRERVRQLDMPLLSEVRPEQGGHSIYAQDPDGHVVEFATREIWNVSAAA
jgi:catechol 2,3-dioxygenase-like lactoylglutathione lyase family enzyme